MQRSPDSHKGENGKVAVIGGSLSMHGAPILAALAAEAAGPDLLYLALPRCHAETSKARSLNFQVHAFRGDDLAAEDVGPLLRMLATVDAAVIGPGLARTDAAQRLIRELVEGAPRPLILDASALQPWTVRAARGKDVILTPHLGELERMGIARERVAALAEEEGIVFHVKGPVDRIAARGGTLEVSGGNARLTVGGTGDALAGLIAGLRAQGVPAPEACRLASRLIKRGAEGLAETRATFTAEDVIRTIPRALRALP